MFDLNNTVKDYSKPSFTIQTKNLSSTRVTIYGDMFKFKTLNGLYLSSSNVGMSSIKLDLYSNVKSISARYPAIDVLSVYNYSLINNENINDFDIPINLFPVYTYELFDSGKAIQFKLPEDLLIGNYDIIYFNGAGYYKASSSTRFTYFTVVSSIIKEPIIDPSICINWSEWSPDPSRQACR